MRHQHPMAEVHVLVHRAAPRPSRRPPPRRGGAPRGSAKARTGRDRAARCARARSGRFAPRSARSRSAAGRRACARRPARPSGRRRDGRSRAAIGSSARCRRRHGRGSIPGAASQAHVARAGRAALGLVEQAHVEAADDLAGGVGRPVVDDQDLDVAPGLRGERRQCLADGPSTVQDRKDDADRRLPAHASASTSGRLQPGLA